MSVTKSVFLLNLFSYLQQMFKNQNAAHLREHAAHIDSRVDIALMQTMPDFNQSLLQFINTVDPCLVHALLLHAA